LILDFVVIRTPVEKINKPVYVGDVHVHPPSHINAATPLLAREYPALTKGFITNIQSEHLPPPDSIVLQVLTIEQVPADGISSYGDQVPVLAETVCVVFDGDQTMLGECACTA
jgi:hypothetical protein